MNSIKLFESKQIRSVWNDHDQKWYFVVEDVISVLTGSNDPKQYLKRLRSRDAEFQNSQPRAVLNSGNCKNHFQIGTREDGFGLIK